MNWLNHWDIILLAIAAFFAVTSLVRLMRRRRIELIEDLQQQIARRQTKGQERQSTTEK